MKTCTLFDPLMKDTQTCICTCRWTNNNMKYRHHNFASARTHIYIYLVVGQHSHAAVFGYVEQLMRLYKLF